jgi:predicted  nucleic acid-binding Zn-ribbon protein
VQLVTNHFPCHSEERSDEESGFPPAKRRTQIPHFVRDDNKVGGWQHLISCQQPVPNAHGKIVAVLLLKMLPDVQNLIALQQADREILRLKEEIAALPKRVAAIEQRLAGTRAVLEKAKTSVKADEAARRKFESAISDQQQKISKYRDQSLAVKTNEQYKALLHEIQFAEQDIRANEDKILELMVNAEIREKDVKAAEAELKSEMAEIEKEKIDARQRTAEDEKQLAEWNAKREKARAGVDADLLRQYDRVAKHRGSGLSEARDHKCLACQVMLRPQTYNEVRAGAQVVVCESCQRILFYDPANDEAADPAVIARRRRAHPKFESSQAWYYRPSFEDHGEVFLVYINNKGDSSRHVYDSSSGRGLGDILVREGEYRLAFPEDLTNDAIRLNGSWSESELEEWGNELPTATLDALHRDLDLARAESRTRSHARNEAIASEHPAAS